MSFVQDAAYISGNDGGTCGGTAARSADSPLAGALRAGQRNVTDVGSLVELMRGPELSSIGRTDLWIAGDGTLDADRMLTGTLDLKVAAAHANGFVAASGPPFTADRQRVEPFRWSDSPIRHFAHHGHPDVWDFDAEGANWVWG